MARKKLNQEALNSPEGEQDQEQEEAAADAIELMSDKVLVKIPKAFILTLDDHTQVKFAPGMAEIPEYQAQHWYSKAMGVVVQE